MKVCDSYVKVGGFFSTLTIMVAVVYNRYDYRVDLGAEIPNILDSLRRAERKVPFSVYFFYGLST